MVGVHPGIEHGDADALTGHAVGLHSDIATNGRPGDLECSVAYLVDLNGFNVGVLR